MPISDCHLLHSFTVFIHNHALQWSVGQVVTYADGVGPSVSEVACTAHSCRVASRTPRTFQTVSGDGLGGLPGRSPSRNSCLRIVLRCGDSECDGNEARLGGNLISVANSRAGR